MLCPLCSRDNRCAVAAGDNPASCWCVNAVFPSGLLERLPEALRDKVCICMSCQQSFLRESGE
ncbi:cysteine-rich CWC family protein [Paenibacillus pasadenensis]|nr:cysteine-rich CWC family protein [Paenibacillus pasadenensis]MCM3748429.1 cysteine-rich CWC family protein [Paenibacillus pasadenensis]